MDDEDRRQREKFDSDESKERWGTAGAILLCVMVPLALVLRAFGWG